MISKEEVQHIAKLARLGLKEEELEKFQKDLSSILDYIETLKKVDISNVEPTSHSVLIENLTRKDEIKKSNTEEKIVKQFPEQKDNFNKVKHVL